MTKKAVEHGHALVAQSSIDREIYKAGHRVFDIEGFIHRGAHERFVVRAIKFRAGSTPGAEWMAVITAYSPGGPIVAFHSGDGFKDTLLGLASRLKNGSLKWKDDKYG